MSILWCIVDPQSDRDKYKSYPGQFEFFPQLPDPNQNDIIRDLLNKNHLALVDLTN